MSQEHKAYRFRLRPTKAQEEALRRFAGARRWIWNWALAKRQAYYRVTGNTLPISALEAELVVLKKQPETAWLKEVDSQLLQQALRDLQVAYGRFFDKKARFPRFKSRKREDARFRIPQRVSVVGRAVVVPKLGAIRLFLSQALDAEPRIPRF
jgi:putative transposase